MKFMIEMNVYELGRSINGGTLEALIKDMQASEDEAGQKPKEKPAAEPVAEKVEPVAETLEPVAEKAESTTEKETVAPDITETQLRAKFVELSKKGKKTKLKALLSELGVEKVSDLEPKHYQEAMTKLEAI